MQWRRIMKEDCKPVHNNIECEKIIIETYNGILVMCNNNEPYAVPINHAYENGCFYFHGAPHGTKLDTIRKNSSVVYVITKYCGKPEDFQKSMKCHGHWESIIAYGNAKIAENKDEYRDAFKRFMKYYGRNDFEPSESSYSKTKMILIEVEKMTARREYEKSKTEYFIWKK
jgi:nitroimidazol reductase NimA-like FMN-containing flavoprotein (pyridoxamine 5'-phosphate oxidase superfamily)